MEAGPAGRVIFWSARYANESPVLRDIKRAPRPVQAFFIDRLGTFERGEVEPVGIKRLKHLRNMCEIKHRSDHGHWRLIYAEYNGAIVVLDFAKKQRNETITKVAEQRLKDWKQWN